MTTRQYRLDHRRHCRGSSAWSPQSRGWRARNAPNTSASKPAASATTPSKIPTRSSNAKRLLTSWQPRPPQAEGEAMAPHSAVLQHQAQARHTDAATSHTEVNREFERADEIDPDCPIADTPSDMPRGDAAGRRDQPRMSLKAGSLSERPRILYQAPRTRRDPRPRFSQRLRPSTVCAVSNEPSAPEAAHGLPVAIPSLRLPRLRNPTSTGPQPYLCVRWRAVYPHGVLRGRSSTAGP